MSRCRHHRGGVKAEVIAWVVDETRESSSTGAVGGGSWIREVEAASKAEVNKGRERRERVNLGGAASGTSVSRKWSFVVMEKQTGR